MAEASSLSDELLLDALQRAAFGYFLGTVNPANGLVADNSREECGFLHYGWEGYSEALLLYALALGSPTHPLRGECYKAWTSTYQWENLYGYAVLYAGPLFEH